ncbi:MAG TPA: PIN domain nuclease [Candidatus Sulfotelmatobacter sp.]|nr:PIN domain nuclease [Candidatus Sulfotelmatobacter sp.]
MVIVDTTVWIDYLSGAANPEVEWLDRELPQQPIGLTDLILCEVLQGVRSQSEFNRVRKQMLAFHVFASGGQSHALAAAGNYRNLRQRGYTVRKTIDCWIATFCMEERHALLHRDRDFDVFERLLGLRVIHP